MSVIIKDMQKPKRCTDCPCLYDDTGVCRILDRTVLTFESPDVPPEDCPIEEVGHGEWTVDDMGQHKYNPRSIACSRGELPPKPRKMSKYIDADMLIKELQSFIVFLGLPPDSYIFGLRRAKFIINEQPAADVLEVKHATWECVNESENIYMCVGENGCGYEILITEGTPLDNDMIFCPHCGAKMDGGTK